MADLNITLFGRMSVFTAQGGEVAFATRKSRSLFGYLALGRMRSFSRATLAAEFWPEASDERANGSLNTEVWRVRQALRAADLEPDHFIRCEHDALGFRNESPHWIDAAAFDEMLRPVLAENPPPAATASAPSHRPSHCTAAT
jgi:DNA-binding SARP family transcriptional activator